MQTAVRVQNVPMQSSKRLALYIGWAALRESAKARLGAESHFNQRKLRDGCSGGSARKGIDGGRLSLNEARGGRELYCWRFGAFPLNQRKLRYGCLWDSLWERGLTEGVFP